MSKDVRHTGKIIGHLVRFLPYQETQLGGGAALVKQPKIGAFVQIQVDGKKFYTVRSEQTELELKDTEPTEELHTKVYNQLVEAHPFGAEREFVEHVSPKRGKKGATKRNELIER